MDFQRGCAIQAMGARGWLLHTPANTWHCLPFSYIAIRVNVPECYIVALLSIICLMTSVAEYMSTCLLAPWIPSLVKCLL